MSSVAAHRVATKVLASVDRKRPALRTGGRQSRPAGILRHARDRSEAEPAGEASGGGLLWLADNADPDIRAVRPGRSAGGSDWIGLRRNEGYTVSGIDQTPLLPGILVALAFLMAIASAWWREGR